MKPNKVAETLTLAAGIRVALCSNLGQDLKWHWADLSTSTSFSPCNSRPAIPPYSSIHCHRRCLILAVDSVVK